MLLAKNSFAIPAATGTYFVQRRIASPIDPWVAITGSSALPAAVLTDPIGSSVYVAGRVPGGTADTIFASAGLQTDTLVLASTSRSKGHVVKYDASSGKVLWGVFVTSADGDASTCGASLGPFGSLYSAGYSSASATMFMSSSNNVAVQQGAFLAGDGGAGIAYISKHTASGALHWRARVTGIIRGRTGRHSVGLAVDSEGGVVVACHVAAGANVTLFHTAGPSTLWTGDTGDSNIVLVKLDVNGVFLWSALIAAPSGTHYLATQPLAIDPNTGDVCVLLDTDSKLFVYAGKQGRPRLFVPTPGTPTSVAVMLSDAGDPLWHARIDGALEARGVAVVDGGFIGVVAAVSTAASIVASNGSSVDLPVLGTNGAVVAAFDSMGSLRWRALVRSVDICGVTCDRARQLMLYGRCTNTWGVHAIDGLDRTSFAAPDGTSNVYAVFAPSGGLVSLKTHTIGDSDRTECTAAIDTTLGVAVTAAVVGSDAAVCVSPDRDSELPVGGGTDMRSFLSVFPIALCFDLPLPRSFASLTVVNGSGDDIVVAPVGSPATFVKVDGARSFAWSQDLSSWQTPHDVATSYPQKVPSDEAHLSFVVNPTLAPRATPDGQVFESRQGYRAWANRVSGANPASNVLLDPDFTRPSYVGRNTEEQVWPPQISSLYVELPAAIYTVGYTVQASETASDTARTWHLFGSSDVFWKGDDGMTWTELDARYEQTAWNPYEVRTYDISGNTSTHKWFRMDLYVPQDGDIAIGRLRFLEGDPGTLPVQTALQALAARVTAVERMLQR